MISSVKRRAFALPLLLLFARFKPTLAQSSLAPPPPGDPATVGQWAGPFNWPLVSIHSTLLPSGKVLLYDDHTDNAGAQLWDPVNDTLTAKPYVSQDLFCSGHTLLPDGRVFVTGGHFSTYVGIRNSTFFNPTTLTWSAGPLMATPRWYPTATSLPSGKVLVTSGADNCPTCGSPGGSHAGIALVPEVYDPNLNTWSSLSPASLSIPLYPHLLVIPDGRVLLTGSQEEPVATRALDLTTQTWTTIDSNVRDGGSSVQYRPGKILKTGSGRNPDYNPQNAAATAYVIDMNAPSPSWRAVASMSAARTQHNLTVLPDGNVLLVGGATTSDVYATASAVKPAAIWSPTTEMWTAMAAMSEPRLYHSTSLLLPDGRVLVAGGGRFGPDFPSAEIFSPPYLFKGARPVITSAPAVVAYNNHFTVSTPDAAQIASVALLRLGSVTHAFDENQRYVDLTFSPVAGGLDVTAPASGNIAPPGYYMLFLVNANGVPSVSTMVRFPAPWEDNVQPTAPGNLAAQASTGSALLTWDPASDNTGVVRYNVHRAVAPNVTPSPANRVGQSTTTSFTDTGFATGTYTYVVTAEDGAGNVGPKSNEATTSVFEDATPPTISMTAPGSGAVVTGVAPVTATANDDIGVAGVQFLLDGVALNAEDTVAPFATDWNSGQSANGPHTLSARARDARGNLTTSAGVPVTVSNAGIPNLQLAYSLDEGSGTAVYDSSGNANRGTIVAGSWSTGHTGSALSYDGAGDYIQTPSAPSINVMSSGLTVSMWVNITAGSAIDYVLLAKPWNNGTTGNPSYSYGLEYDANGAHTIDFYFGDTLNTTRGPYSVVPATGGWTHVAYTYDGTTVKGYLDGVLKIAAPADGQIQTRPTNLRLGVDPAGNQGFKGKLDDVRIYNRALTQLEIQTDMGKAVSPAVPPVPDGSFGASMKASRVIDDGSTISVTWDVAACAAKGYHTIFGPLSGVSTYQTSGGRCGMGVSGSSTWSSVPAGDLWFVVAADDNASTEGTWGNRTVGGLAMNNATPSGVCGMVNRINLATCP
jgi:hypothetical protein